MKYYPGRIWFWCLLLLIAGSVSVAEGPKILLINSDRSVEKYREPHNTFKEEMVQPIAEIDLGDPQWSDPTRIEDMLYDKDPDIIYAIGTKAYLIANKYLPKKQIVFSSVINWLRLPKTGTTYGVSNELHAGQEIMLFRLIFPNIQKIGVLYSKAYTEEWFKHAKDQAQEMGVEIIGQTVARKKAIPALQKLLPKVDAFWLISDPELMAEKEDLLNILQECDAQKIPVFSYHEAFANLGAVFIVAPSNPTMGRQAAGMVKDLLAGNAPDEKVVFPAGTFTILNLNKVQEYGLPYDEGAIVWIDQIILE